MNPLSALLFHAFQSHTGPRSLRPDGRNALPTEESGAGPVFRAKRFSQRPLAHMGPRRQRAFLSA